MTNFTPRFIFRQEKTTSKIGDLWMGKSFQLEMKHEMIQCFNKIDVILHGYMMSRATHGSRS